MNRQLESSEDDPITYVNWAIAHYEKKANRNEITARLAIVFTIVISSLIPILLVLEDPGAMAKILLAVASGAVGGLNIWIQWENPRAKWRLYRSTQRRLEAERVSFRAGLTPYSDSATSRQIFYTRVRDIVQFAHDRWDSIVEKSELTQAVRPKKRGSAPGAGN